MFTTKNLLMLTLRHILIAGSAIVIAGFVTFFISTKIEGITKSVIKNRQLASTLEKRTELFATLKHDTETVGTNDVLIEKAFPSSDNILEFISALENIATKNGVTQSFHFNTPTPSATPAPFTLSTVSYSNNLSGNLPALINYLKDFEHLPYFTKIDTINLSSADRAGFGQTTSLSFNATLQTKSPQ
jgi:Tfp pilus assembly protein PilO